MCSEAALAPPKGGARNVNKCVYNTHIYKLHIYKLKKDPSKSLNLQKPWYAYRSQIIPSPII